MICDVCRKEGETTDIDSERMMFWRMRIPIYFILLGASLMLVLLIVLGKTI